MVAQSDQLVTVFGGSGFLGRHVVRALVKHGYRIRVAVRRPDLALHLMTSGAVGQINPVQANLRYPDSVARALDGADAVVNLVGVLFPSGRNTFEATQAFGARAIARAAAEAGVRSLVHVSAIGADPDAPSVYARTKAQGEAHVLEAVPGAVLLRPSIVFGPEDDFFNKFASMARFAPALPLIGGGRTRFQPVFAGDVAQAVANGVDGRLRPGATYELGGPEVLSFRDILSYILRVVNRRRLLVPLPFGVARLMGSVLQYAPKPPLTPDQVLLLERDNVVSEAAIADRRTLEGAGVAATALEAVVPGYLWRFRKTGQFEKMPV